MLEKWRNRIPILQHVSPAEMAASVLLQALEELEDLDDEYYTVIDFCSGAGGPVPVIEKLVNSRRAEHGLKPIPFLLTDIQPHLDAWMDAASRSANLSFIPQPVDATHPPVSAISETASANDPFADFSSDTKVFRLYCLSFHHFNDDTARRVLQSTLDTSDAFAIIELQDRRAMSLLLVVLDFFSALLFTLFWFPRDPLHLLFTYLTPALPLMQAFDGVVSCLRTRTFEEILALVDALPSVGKRRSVTTLGSGGMLFQKTRRRDWRFVGGRLLHTWPIGYMNFFYGRKTV
ncbi:hypothetical protein LTR50_004455 [Elasticomyces elasticus]|nr:hypothetical protein LTR50_004455 [Elasticomyces elasticus]